VHLLFQKKKSIEAGVFYKAVDFSWLCFLNKKKCLTCEILNAFSYQLVLVKKN